jgi:FtsZ-interacting cell division protein ZipA
LAAAAIVSLIMAIMWVRKQLQQSLDRDRLAQKAAAAATAKKEGFVDSDQVLQNFLMSQQPAPTQADAQQAWVKLLRYYQEHPQDIGKLLVALRQTFFKPGCEIGSVTTDNLVQTAANPFA